MSAVRPPAQPPPIILSPTGDDEDAIIHARITNDERPLRRVLKKFHHYTSVSHDPIVPPVSADGTRQTVEDAREAFLVELESFRLTLKKSVMICEAEARQVDEYLKEKKRIEDEHGKLRGQIEQLKIALEHAQISRRRKIEYDVIAEKINTLPSREELERSIQELESDMEAILTEHDNHNRTVQEQKSALDNIITELGSLRFIGKDREAISHAVSPAPTAEGSMDVIEENADVGHSQSLVNSASASVVDGGTADVGDVGEAEDSANGRMEKTSVGGVRGPSLNPGAKPFYPRGVVDQDDDIEMGEVAEEPKDAKGKKKAREDLEEGEASDSSSDLTEPPDD